MDESVTRAILVSGIHYRNPAEDRVVFDRDAVEELEQGVETDIE